MEMECVEFVNGSSFLETPWGPQLWFSNPCTDTGHITPLGGAWPVKLSHHQLAFNY